MKYERNEEPVLYWVTTPSEVLALAGHLKGTSWLGVDTEFIRETTFFPRMALIQLATSDRVWLVDPLKLSHDGLKPLFEVLKDETILKVVHSSYADQECVFWSYGFTLSPVFDTAVGAALSGYGDNIGLAKLLRDVLHVMVSKGHARAKWLERPLPEELVSYAREDVRYLVRLAEVLCTKLRQENRWEWALSASTIDPTDFEISPEQFATRHVKGGHLDQRLFMILVELFRWRENRARQANLPRQWVADNEVIVSLGRAQPKTERELKSFRGISIKEIERSGAEILEAIRRGISQTPETLPKRCAERRSFDDHSVNLAKAFLSFLSDRYGVSSRLLVAPAQLPLLLECAGFDETEWIRRGILSSHAARLVGPDLKAFLMGSQGLVFKHGRVHIVNMDEHPVNPR